MQSPEISTEQFKNYLMWLEDRGQIWLPHENLQTPEPNLSDGPPKSETTAEKSFTSEAHQQKIETPAAIQTLFSSAGSNRASLVVLVDFIEEQKIIFGSERELLIKMMSALKINLKNDFLLIGMKTDSTCLPIATQNAYHNEFVSIIKEIKPKKIISFGSLSASITSTEMNEFQKTVNKLKLFMIEDSGIPLLSLHHLQELIREPQLKKQTWIKLQELMNK